MNSYSESRLLGLIGIIMCITIFSVVSFALVFITIDASFLGTYEFSGFELLEMADEEELEVINVVLFASIASAAFSFVAFILPNAVKGTLLSSAVGLAVLVIVALQISDGYGSDTVGIGIYLCGTAHLLSVVLSIAFVFRFEDETNRNSRNSFEQYNPAEVEQVSSPIEGNIPERKPENKQPALNVIPVTNYYPEHDFRVINCLIENDDSAHEHRFKLQLAAFSSQLPRALQIQLQWVTLWGEKILTPAVTCFEFLPVNGYHETEWLPMSIQSSKIKEFVAVKHRISKVMFVDHAVYVKDNPVDVSLNPDDLLVLRRSTLEYAVTPYSEKGGAWQCICGKVHSISVKSCDLCRYNNDSPEVLVDYILRNQNNFKSASEIYEYIKNCACAEPHGTKKYAPILTKAEEIAKLERTYGNSKADILLILKRREYRKIQ